ncbi:hypothetical protein [Microbispora sp. NPDC046933]|uniref:hypothetical protein n=1 Tax=Microbispora sp. NPDC046933 TaxID=3155618 RepID=UPI0033D29193
MADATTPGSGEVPSDRPRIENAPKHWQPSPLSDISDNAYNRLYAMTLEETYAAEVMAQPDSYADFFLESPQTRFHEFVGPPELKGAEVRASRMAMVDRLRLAGEAKYPDFFVDSPHNGPPFHEKFLDKGPPKPKSDEVEGEINLEELVSPVGERVRMLSQSRVLAAFMRMQQSAGQ